MYLTEADFQRILNEYGVFVSHDDLKGLVGRYDQNKDGVVDYKEFSSSMVPKSPTRF